MPRRPLDDLSAALVPALTMMFGLQLVRSLVTGLVFYLRDAVGVATPLVGLYASALFLASFLAPVVHRLLGPRKAVALTVVGVGVARVAEQLVSSAPVDLAVATIGTALWLLAVPLYVSHARSGGPRAGGALGLGVLLGIAGDTALKGSLGTVDLSWHEGVWPLLLVVILAAGLIVSLTVVLRSREPATAGRSGGSALPLLAIGPVLLLELLLLQNIGQQTVLTEWKQPQVFAWIVAANLVGVAVATLALRWRGALGLPAATVLGALLIGAVFREWSGVAAATAIAVGQTAVSLSLVLVALAAFSGAPAGRVGRTSVASGCGMLLLMLLLFAYYAGYDIDSLLPREAVTPLAAAIVLVCVAVAARSLPEIQPDDVRSWAAPAVALLLLLLPVGYWLAWDEPVAEQGAGGPVRVMSYNLHQGFGIDGRLELEELAKVIEAEGADVVALQEVSRGWVVDGSVDMLVWLSNRLDMVYEWGPAADSVWGNAVLSRYPLSDGETRPMPNNAELRLKRALTSVQVHVGNSQTLNVIVTHLTHSAGTSAQRLDQVNAILGSVGDSRPTVVMGDMNARPHDAEMVRLQDAGLVDAFVASGTPGPGYTSRPDDPVKRIDYIWMSPDLASGDFSIAPSRASDHLPIAVTVSR